MFKLCLDHKITVFFNWMFKTSLNRLISISILLGIVSIILFGYSLALLSIVFILSVLLSLTIKRVSNNFNLNRLTGTLNMSLLDPKEYWQLSYIREKNEIADKLKYGFMTGIFVASYYKKNIKMRTHKWVIENVINDKRIKDCFHIEVKEKKLVKLKSEILMLINKEELKRENRFIKQTINREKKGYAVKLMRKE